jgi:hypothetical protein
MLRNMWVYSPGEYFPNSGVILVKVDKRNRTISVVTTDAPFTVPADEWYFDLT